MRLLIISHVRHHRAGGRLYAYGPYAREIEVWADLFAEIVIAAPCSDAPPPADALPIERANVTIAPQRETGGTSIAAKLKQLALLPLLAADLWRAMGRADAVQIRCPGNLGLLGALLAPLRRHYRVAKYAGMWGPYPGEPPSVRLQRAILRSRYWGAPTLVYGDLPGQPAHIVPFFASVMDKTQMQRATQIAAERASAAERAAGNGPLRLLYVGRLSQAKRVDVVLRAVAALVPNVRLTVVGDGPQRATLEALAAELGIAASVTFAGAQPFAEMERHYAAADALALVSETEGWPKAIAEGMAYGLLCVGADRGAVPWLLADGRGLTVPVGDVAALAAALRGVRADPQGALAIGRAAAEWSRRFTRDGFGLAIGTLLRERWAVDRRDAEALR